MSLESAQFIAGLKQSQQATAAAANSINKSIGSIKAAAGGLAAALYVDQIMEATQRAFDYADAIQDLADKTGASTTFIQQFGYAAQLSGSSVESARGAIEKFSKNLGEAISGNKAMANEMAALGVNSKNVDQAIKQAADGISKLETSSERAAATARLFGKAGIDLTNTLSQGADGLSDFAKRAEEIGVVLNPELIANAGKFNDEMDTLKMITDAQMAQAITQNAGAIIALNSALTGAGSALAQFWSQNPREAMAILGALGGGMVAGVPGAIIGATGGFALGQRARQQRFEADPIWRSLKKREDNAQKEEAASLRRGEGRSRANTYANLRNSTMKERVQYEQLILAGGVTPRAAPSSAGGAPPANSGTWTPPAGGAKPKKSGGGRSGPSAAELAEREADRRMAFERELTSATVDQLNARQQLLPNIVDQQVVEREILALQRDQHLADIERSVVKKDLTRAEADQLIALEQQSYLLKADLINHQENETLAREALAISRAANDNLTDQLSADRDLARSSGERRKIALRLVDLQFEQEKLALEAIRNSKDSTDAEKKIAEARLAALPNLKKSAEASARRETMSPGASFLDSIPKTAGEINDALEGVAVNGLQTLQSGLLDTIRGVGDLGDAFGKVTDMILADLLKLAIQKAIIGPLGDALFGGSSGGGLFGGLFKGIGKRANGGYTSPGNYLVGERGPEMLSIGSAGHVTNNSQLRGLKSNGGGVTINFGPITSNDPEAVRRMAAEAIMAAIPSINKQSSDYTMSRLGRRTL